MGVIMGRLTTCDWVINGKPCGAPASPYPTVSVDSENELFTCKKHTIDVYAELTEWIKALKEVK